MSTNSLSLVRIFSAPTATAVPLPRLVLVTATTGARHSDHACYRRWARRGHGNPRTSAGSCVDPCQILIRCALHPLRPSQATSAGTLSAGPYSDDPLHTW